MKLLDVHPHAGALQALVLENQTLLLDSGVFMNFNHNPLFPCSPHFFDKQTSPYPNHPTKFKWSWCFASYLLLMKSDRRKKGFFEIRFFSTNFFSGCGSGTPIRKDRFRLRIRPSLDVNFRKFDKFRRKNPCIFYKL